MNWLKDAIIYQLIIDRFSNGRPGDEIPKTWGGWEFCGGNLRGVINKLDYLRDLGINALMLSPFFKTSAYHGYHVTDLYKVEPRFGSEDDLRELIKKAHMSGIKIIIDFVPNHFSVEHPYFADASSNSQSKYRDWFYFRKWPHDYVSFLGFRELPKLNLKNPEARLHVIEAAKHWLSFGVDGLRLDHVIGISKDFWEEFKREIKSSSPDVVLIGEAVKENFKFSDLKTFRFKGKYEAYLRSLLHLNVLDFLIKKYAGLFDGVLDFRFNDILKRYALEKIKTIGEARLLLEKHYEDFSEETMLVSLLDNADVNRFLLDAGQDKEKLKEAAKLQFSLPHPPMIYYGTEVGLSQDRPRKLYGDADIRRPMLWGGDQDKELLDFYKGLIRDRKTRGISK